MIFQTFEHGYEVIHLHKTLDCGTFYVCRDTETGKIYSLLCVTDETLIPKLVSYFSTRINGRVFTDFSEYFFHERKLCVTWRHAVGKTLEAKLSEASLTLAERLEIGKRILSRIVLQEPPAYFLKKCLSPSAVIVDDGLEVGFQYVTEDPEHIESCTGAEISEGYLSVFRVLFSEELERKSPSPLMLFLQGFPARDPFDFLSLYTAYCAMEKEVLALPEADIKEPDTWPFRLWEKVKRIAGKLKKLLMWILIFAAVGYLIFTVGESVSDDKTGPPFHMIGDIEITE